MATRDDHPLDRHQQIKLLRQTSRKLAAIANELRDAPVEITIATATLKSLIFSTKQLSATVNPPTTPSPTETADLTSAAGTPAAASTATPTEPSPPNEAKPTGSSTSNRQFRGLIFVGVLVLVIFVVIPTVTNVRKFLAHPIASLTQHSPTDTKNITVEDVSKTDHAIPSENRNGTVDVIGFAESDATVVTETTDLTTDPLDASDVMDADSEPAPLEEDTTKPEIALTPEEEFLKSVQDAVTAISQRYVKQKPPAIAADTSQGRLQVILGEEWFSLNPRQQQKFANELFQQAQQLKFPQLTLTTSDGTLLSRPPVVGQQMVIVLSDT